MRDLNRIKAENIKRHKKLFPEYDPIRGVNSPVKRFNLYIDANNYITLPEICKEEPLIKDIIMFNTVAAYYRANISKLKGIKLNDIIVAITEIRLKQDFEFWAATCGKIKDKLSPDVVPFVLRPAQRKLLKELEDMRWKNMPIRIILLKARQWGGSTMIQIYMVWIQLFHMENWNSVIIAHTEDAARNIRSMYTRVGLTHPKDIQKMTFKPFEGSQKNRVLEERGCVIGIGSSEKPDSQRSFDIKMTHLSEVAFFKSTELKSAEDLVQSIRGSVPSLPYTVAVLESTAKGVGNFFHKEWLIAEEGNSGYRPVFVAWWEIEIYLLPVPNVFKFVAAFTEHDWYLWDLGATLEGINWYKTFKNNENYDDWRMSSEFPSTSVEAFQSTGRRAFAPEYVLRARKNVIDPIFVGEVYGDATKGEGALKNLELKKVSTGDLKIWSFPDNTPVSNRYIGFADIGGRNPKADYSVLKVFDRYWMIDGGVPEVAAIYRTHMDQDLFAWKCAQIMWLYNKGLLAVEVNSLIKRGLNSEGSHHLTVLDEISPYYQNLYTRTNPERIIEGAPIMYGFHTNQSTKPMIIDTLNAAIRDEGYIERDKRTCDEMDSYELKNTGVYGAVDGAKDDCVVVTAGGLWISQRMDLPRIISGLKPKSKRNILTEAMI